MITVEINLHRMEADGNTGLTFAFLFTHQPTKADIMCAWDFTPSLTKREDADWYRRALLQCLNTYGVPQLDMIRTHDTDGTEIKVSMLRADWFMNMESKDHSISGWPSGRIVVTRRQVHNNTPVETQPEAKPLRKRAPRKAKP
jgi:hypothetical protein